MQISHQIVVSIVKNIQHFTVGQHNDFNSVQALYRYCDMRAAVLYFSMPRPPLSSLCITSL